MSDDGENTVLGGCSEVAYEPPRIEEDLPLEVGSLACAKSDDATCSAGPIQS